MYSTYKITRSLSRSDNIIIGRNQELKKPTGDREPSLDEEDNEVAEGKFGNTCTRQYEHHH